MGDCNPSISSTLETGFSDNDPLKIARQYQKELARKAVEENVIVVLETGCGKTLIAILLMTHMRDLIKKPLNKRVCVFLAPTVVLVNQQARVIKQFTDFKVGIYSGEAKHIKSHSDWERELTLSEVLVMTPQVLLRNLCHCFIRMENIALLIFDECHYAQLESHHPYAEIMKVFYDSKRGNTPRIFGMTASPICGKGASINSLQSLLHAKVYTVNDNSELESVVVSPLVRVFYYSSSGKLSSSSLERCMEILGEIKRQCTSMLCSSGDDPCKVQNSRKALQRLHNNMVFTLTSLGLWGTLQACRILLDADACEISELIEVVGNAGQEFVQNGYIARIISLLGTECNNGITAGTSSDLSCMKFLQEPYFSQKILRLVAVLSNFRSRPDMKCIIFVNRIIIARALAYILGQIKILSAWKCDFLVGVHSGLKGVSRNTMSHILEEFRSGQLNLLVATKVGEEGLDIQTCCLVIRFDLPETLASFIQSRGRARMPQSEYAFLVDSESEREMNLMDSFRRGEDRMNMEIRDRKADEVDADTKEEVYPVCSTGATISAQTSISLLYHYCSKLPRDEFFNPKPDLCFVDDTEGTVCHIILPCNAPIHHIVGASQSSIEAAKRNACLRACRELHEIGALTDYLLPEQDEISEDAILDVPDLESPQGDKDSRFELQEMLVPAALKEPWSYTEYPICLSSYFIRFIPKPFDRKYKEFGLFLRTALPQDAERLKIDLHLAHGRSVLTDLIPSGVVDFDEEEILLAQNFQEMCLKVILDRSDFMCDHVPLRTSNISEPNASKFYLLLPVIQQDYRGLLSVDWMTIKRCLSSTIFSPRAQIQDGQTPMEGNLWLADGPVSVSVVLNSLVYVEHKKSFFFVSQVLSNKNAYDLHNSSKSHIEHLCENLKIHLAHPEQPLLLAKQLFCLHNLLHDRKKGNSESRELEEHFFELPPELCKLKIIGFSKDIGSTLSLLPSIMHRLENLLVAIELKDLLSESFVEGAAITTDRVLEALTTEKCHERFSLERLEVLGDAFLKFAVGRHLFLKHGAYDEGQLTRRRSNLVNNANLYKLAIKNKLQVYIRDQEFDPDQFFALGRPCSIICTKQSEALIHSDSETNLIDRIETRQVRCSKNHLWLSKKTIADVVEALVGAYLVDSGFKAAIAFLRWIGIEVEFEVSQVCRAWTASVRFMSLADRIDLHHIEGILGHQFVHRGLLLQAFVHPSYNQHGGGCYQRLEFLGDAVLDYLITSYLYSVFPDLKPGQLTILRSSLVNNSTFARIAANSLHKFIICENSILPEAIAKFVNFVEKPASERDLLEEPPCPKALGDLIESCIGAILLDAGFDLNHVWKLVLSLLNPIIEFSNLQLSPIKELIELCQHYGWNVEFLTTKKPKSFMVEAVVTGEKFSTAASAFNRSKSTAKKMAAQQVIAKLKAQGYKLKTKSLEEILKTLRRMEARLVGFDETPLAQVSAPDVLNNGNLSLKDKCSSSTDHVLNLGNLCLEDHPRGSVNLDTIIPLGSKILSTCNKKVSEMTSISTRLQHNNATEEKSSSVDSDAHSSGGPRKSSAKARLNEICVAKCWEAPSYECCNEEGPGHLKMFTFKVVVVMEEAEVVTLESFGRPQVKKKAAAEEAAEGALWWLKKEGYISN